MQIIKYSGQELSYEDSKKFGKLFLNRSVGLGYGVSSENIRQHLSINKDELVEGIHYIKEYAQTKGGKQKVIKWTPLGVYHLGFFIKSKEAKEFRKFMANIANAIDPYEINEKHHQHQILGYKSQLVQYKKKLALARAEIEDLKSFQSDSYTIELYKENQEFKKMIELKEDKISLQDQIKTLEAELAIAKERETRSKMKSGLQDTYFGLIEGQLEESIKKTAQLLGDMQKLSKYGVEKTSYGAYTVASEREEIKELT